MAESLESAYNPISGFIPVAVEPQVDRTSRADQGDEREDLTEPREDRTEMLSPWVDGLVYGREEWEWEALWEKLLPVDYEQILSRAVDRVVYSSKKELYFRLHQPLLLDRGTKSFVLDMNTGKICYTFSARALRITHGSNREHWRWVRHADSRFAEVAELVKVFWLNVDGKVDSSELSPRTTYAAYLIFKLPSESSFGFANQTQKALISIGTANLVDSIVRIEPREGDGEEGEVPSPREDGWMELYLGKFYIHEQMNEKIEIAFKEVEILEEKNGLIVEGIEVRPHRQ